MVMSSMYLVPVPVRVGLMLNVFFGRVDDDSTNRKLRGVEGPTGITRYQYVPYVLVHALGSVASRVLFVTGTYQYQYCTSTVPLVQYPLLYRYELSARGRKLPVPVGPRHTYSST